MCKCIASVVKGAGKSIIDEGERANSSKSEGEDKDIIEEKYPKVGLVIKDINLQTDFIMYIIGLIKSDFIYIESLANRFTFFEREFIIDFYHLFDSHKHQLCKDGIKGLPQISDEVNKCDIDHQVKAIANKSKHSYILILLIYMYRKE
jgi:hypothetical protein